MKKSICFVLLFAVICPGFVLAAPVRVDPAARIVSSQSTVSLQPFSVECIRQAEAMFRWHAYTNGMRQTYNHMNADSAGLSMGDDIPFARIRWNGDMVLSRAKGPNGEELPPKVYPWGSWCKPVGK